MTTTASPESSWRSEAVRTVPVVACWALSRLVVLGFAVTTVGRLRRSLMGDVHLYRTWAHQLAHHGVRASDHRWQYPAGAALVFRGIGAASGYFPLAFVVAMTACDALILVLLLTMPGPRRTHGAWYWVAALPLLGPISWFRFDLVPTACAVAAVRFGARRWLTGALLGLGIGIKLWPLGLLAGLPRRAYVALVPAVLVGAALALNPWGDPTLFLRNQDSRGIQVESVLATPWIIGQALGHPLRHASSFGSQQLLIATRGISELSIATTIAGLLAIQLAVRRTSWPAAWPAAAFSSVLVLMVTSRVLSPQFMVWALGLAAATIANGRRSDQHRANLLLVLAVLTQVVFPFAYSQYLGGSAPVAAVLAVRNLSLVGLTIWSLVNLFRLTRTAGPATAAP